MDVTSNYRSGQSNILNLRKRLGLSQSAFGSILHYSAMAVSRWETGKIEPSGRCYIQLGNLAGDPEGWQFWSRAGLKRSDSAQPPPAISTVHKKIMARFRNHPRGKRRLQRETQSGRKERNWCNPFAGGTRRRDRGGRKPFDGFCKRRSRGNDWGARILVPQSRADILFASEGRIHEPADQSR